MPLCLVHYVRVCAGMFGIAFESRIVMVGTGIDEAPQMKIESTLMNRTNHTTIQESPCIK